MTKAEEEEGTGITRGDSGRRVDEGKEDELDGVVRCAVGSDARTAEIDYAS